MNRYQINFTQTTTLIEADGFTEDPTSRFIQFWNHIEWPGEPNARDVHAWVTPHHVISIEKATS